MHIVQFGFLQVDETLNPESKKLRYFPGYKDILLYESSPVANKIFLEHSFIMSPVVLFTVV